MLAILDFVFQFFALRILLIMPLCVARLPLLCRSSLLILLIIPQTLLLFQLYYSCLADCARGVNVIVIVVIIAVTKVFVIVNFMLKLYFH